MALKITLGNTDDRAPVEGLTSGPTGKLLADKGYISIDPFHKLQNRGLHLIVGVRKHMKNYMIPMNDTLSRRKRFLVETV